MSTFKIVTSNDYTGERAEKSIPYGHRGSVWIGSHMGSVRLSTFEQGGLPRYSLFAERNYSLLDAPGVDATVIGLGRFDTARVRTIEDRLKGVAAALHLALNQWNAPGTLDALREQDAVLRQIIAEKNA